MSPLTRSIAVVATLGLAFTLASCAPATPAAEPAPTSSVSASESVVVSDAWVKTAAEGMTPAFGTIVNKSDRDLTVIAVRTDVAGVSELHETVMDDDGQMVMRPIDGGFVIPAGGEFPLEPAGNHLMLMDLVGALEPGQEVVFTLFFDDGSQVDFTAVVKDFSGANENYVPDGGEGDMEMDMETPAP